MSSKVVDSVLYRLFEEYLTKKSLKIENLNQTEAVSQAKQFLKETFPYKTVSEYNFKQGCTHQNTFK